MNPVLILTHNNLALTKRCVESVHAQDVRTRIYIIDNGSTDGTGDWAMDEGGVYSLRPLPCNWGVSKGWNVELTMLFAEQRSHALVIGNDTILPKWFLSELLSYDAPFVTGTSIGDIDAIAIKPPKTPLIPHPDFSAFLIRREAWEKIGPFDETMVSWASDCDYHVRAHRLGIFLYKASLPFFHQRSSTITLAPPKERRMMELQADADRQTFYEKYGAMPGTPEYANLFK